MAAFDDDVWGTHPEDFQLLTHGHLHLFRNEWALSRLAADLAGLGYEVVEVDTASCDSADALRAAVIGAIDDWPSDYGRDSWPGFTDGLTDHLLTTGRPLVVLVLKGLDQVRRKDGASTHTLLDLLASIARWHLLFGRRLICLIHTDDIDLDPGPLGGEHPRWNRHEFLLVHRTDERRPPWLDRA
ncbi:barstar family protein [Saccharothrix sp.]|uniref:barstar family protein n=1 Tax=Saccharothrix sp. TaxID=1873460 RepID=UPI0028122412|nr:barstar family protein [Saccharothrix sp.]